MNRLSRFGRLARHAWLASGKQGVANLVTQTQVSQGVSCTGAGVRGALDRGFAAATGDSELATGFEAATGLERQELDGKAKGVDIFKEDWLDLPFGTESKPVKVPSMFAERVIGVPDPNDDSIIWWGSVKEGEGPRQIVEGGEYFVLERSMDESARHGHH